jgi:hypothetical protein
MGYKRKTLKLVFEDEPGLEVYARSVSVRKFVSVMQLADQLVSKPDEASIEEMVTWFADRVISWNLVDDDDQPVPFDPDTLMDEDFDLVFKILMGWVSAISGALKLPPLELTPDTPATGPGPAEEEASIPMSPATPGSESGT